MCLCGIGVISTLVLAATGELTLYIHPRYVVFTVILGVGGALLLAVALWYSAVGGPHPHGHDHGDPPHDGVPEHPARRLRRGAAAVAVAAVVAVSAVALLVVPPSTLSADRALASAATDGSGTADVPPTVLVGSDPARYSVRDWAAILGSGATANDLIGQQADITGFLLLDDTGAVRVGRYAVTCCTVDAQLFAVPLAPGALPAGAASGQWVHVVGTFADDDAGTRLSPTTIEAVEEPDDPYLS
ncbi:hypothetical protein NS220_05985 [Microbacterium testaceum]|uniref:DUF1980 domain-containing protein n=1 Tax=Microbacterium testaceum TaxID=2033 RepID=A0A147EZI6_MICTE|nr:hypothetical protein NS220_05985 [Microbacterium testaceum]